MLGQAGCVQQRSTLLQGRRAASSVALNTSRRSFASRGRAVRMDVSASAVKPQIMVNSVAGNMGKAVAEATLRAGFELVPYTLANSEVATVQKTIAVGGKQVETVGPERRDAVIAEVKQRYPQLVMVDYTMPDVVNEMASFYIKHKIPFVMGTTGGDRAKLTKDVQDAKLYAVIAPNMGKQIVAFQAMFEHAAATFPGAFAGYKLRVIESHQSTKKDTSGTAKAVVASLNDLGLHFDVSQIELVREPKEQVGGNRQAVHACLGMRTTIFRVHSSCKMVLFTNMHHAKTSLPLIRHFCLCCSSPTQVERMKVPADALNGHAFHTYQLVSGGSSPTYAQPLPVHCCTLGMNVCFVCGHIPHSVQTTWVM